MKRIINFEFDLRQLEGLPEETVEAYRRRTIEQARTTASKEIAQRIPVNRVDEGWVDGVEIYEAAFYIVDRSNAQEIEASLQMLERLLPMSQEIVGNIRRELNW